MEMKKIAAVFTGFDASLYSIIDNALRENLTEVDYKLIVHANPSLISETLEAGYPTRDVVRGLLTAFVDSVTEGQMLFYQYVPRWEILPKRLSRFSRR